MQNLQQKQRTNTKKLEKFIDFSIEEKIHLIIYNNQSKFRQSNIGLNNEISSNIGGTSNIEDQKIFLYFNGNHVDLKIKLNVELQKY